MTILNNVANNGIKGLSHTKLFTPLKLGRLDLKHRIIMAPLTRVRSPEHIPDENVVEYYRQRASDGGLQITEATHISVMGGNYHDVPGIFTPEHVRAWKKVTEAVHEKGGFIYCQLWHVGRTTHPLNLGGRAPLSSSASKLEDSQVPFTHEGPKDTVTPKEMTIQDIQDTIEDYGHAAKCAIEAGFDGVEIHGANGYLLDQFICDNINFRTDNYGGNAENRGRIVLEVVDKVVSAVGDASRVGIRFSPFSFYQGTDTSDIHGHFGYVISKLDGRGLSYVHLIEPRQDFVMTESAKIEKLHAIAKSNGVPDDKLAEYATLKPFRDMLKTTPLIVAGGYKDTNASVPIENGEADGVVFGRYFISNPDIVERLRNGWPLNRYDRSTFYVPGPKGYIDYPVYAGLKAANL